MSSQTDPLDPLDPGGNTSMPLRSSTSTPGAATTSGTATPTGDRRFKRFAAKPLKPLKLAASAIGSVPSRIGSVGSISSVGSAGGSAAGVGGCGSFVQTPEEELNVSLGSQDTALVVSAGPGAGSATSATHLEPPTERTEKKRRSLPIRRKHQHTRGSVILDAAQVAQVAQGPRKPLEHEEPAAMLRVRIVSAEGLVVKDRNGSSDPFVSVMLPPATRHSTPVIKRSLSPTFPAASSTFDFPIYLSLAGVIGGRGIEAVVWDKDLMRKEYMGELFVGVDQWFENGQVRLWHDSLPIRKHELISTRRRHKVSGSVSLQIGFLAPPSLDTHEALDKVQKVYTTILQRSFLDGQFGVLGVPAHEGIGTIVMSREPREVPTAQTGVQLLTAMMVAPVSGNPKSETFVEVEDYDFDDDGLSSSDEDQMEDAHEGDEDEHREETAAAIKQSPPTALHGLPTSRQFNESRRSSSGSTPSTPGIPPGTPGTTASPVPPASKRKLFKRKKRRTGEYNLGDNNGVLGIVVMEIVSATDLPKIKNSLRLGWDMDPFVVISFGKKVFRTRVIRHSLNPTWEEKLLFHVHDYEDHFNVQMAVLDWDKISGNDMVGTCTLPLEELIALAPKPDPDTGLYGKNVDGKHDSKEFELPIVTAKGMPWEARHAPKLTVRAKYEPYDALRQRFWRQYTMNYDADDTGTMSYVELTTMLDSLGSTLSRETIESYFSRFGKSADKDELTFNEVVQCLETEVVKPAAEKKVVHQNSVDLVEVSDRLLGSWPKNGDGSGSDAASNTPATTAARTGASTTAASGPTTSSSLSTSTAPSVVSPGVSIPAVTVAEVNAQNETMPVETASPIPSDPEDGSEGEVERVINIKECPLCHRPRLGKRGEQDIITHLAVCASGDWSRVNRLVTAQYVTSSQAQRKRVTKMINKVAIGSYSLGANSANILVQDRLTGQLQEEKMAVYVRIGIRVLYKGARGQMGGARAKKLLKSLSVKQGIKYDSPSSAAEIPQFIEFHNLNVAEIRDPLDSFKTFNEFFYRKLTPDARPIDEPGNDGRIVSAADCRMMAFETISEATQIWIKGRDFSIARLLGPNYADQHDKYDGGALVIFRLAPQDYHRFHSPVKGRIGKMTMIDGEYYTVNPQAIRTALDVYGENVRKIVPIETEEFGTVMTVWVGAMMVGSIGTTVVEGEQVDRGSELGWFAFGGSTLVCIFERGKVVWDEDLLANGRASIETLVRVGMGIGRRA